MFSIDQLTSVLKGLPDPAFILSRSGRYVAIFGGNDKRYYHSGDSLIGKSIGDVLSPEKAAWFEQEIARALASKALHVVEYSLSASDILGLNSDGPDDAIWFEGRIQALDFQVNEEDVVLWSASNISERHALELSLRNMGEIDELSGLYNRRKLMTGLSGHFDTFCRYKVACSLLMFDIDHFKEVNDTHGHLIGDRIIIQIAEICRQELRSVDVVARFGGDEFVVLMPHAHSKDALTISERLRTSIGHHINTQMKLPVHISISGGVSEFISTDKQYEEALKRADSALYSAKRAGRNRITSAHE